MQRKNDSTILILVAAGLGIYWYMKNKSNTAQVNPADQPLAETGFPPTGGTGESGFVDYTPINNDFALFSPPNPSGGGGGIIDTLYLDNPVGRGSGFSNSYVTDMFNGLFDKSSNINNDRMYEK
jgi:hypothetical protein